MGQFDVVQYCVQVKIGYNIPFEYLSFEASNEL